MAKAARVTGPVPQPADREALTAAEEAQLAQVLAGPSGRVIAQRPGFVWIEARSDENSWVNNYGRASNPVDGNGSDPHTD